MSIDPTDNQEELFPDDESDEATDQQERSGEPVDEAAVERASRPRKLEPTVLAHVLAANYQPVKPRVIAKQLKLPSEQHRALQARHSPTGEGRQARLWSGAFGAGAKRGPLSGEARAQANVPAG